MEVLIAGAGIAAASAALRLLQLGFMPRLLAVDRHEIGGVEMLPASAYPLLETLGLGAVLAGLRSARATGLLQRWGESEEFRPGRALHMDRLALREAVLAEAMRRGAAIERVARLPPRPVPSRGGVRCGEITAFAALDATGRRAAWSQPTVKYGRMQADLFAAALAEPLEGGRVARLTSGWAYCAAHDGIATIGVVAPPRPRGDDRMEEAIGALGVSPRDTLSALGRRPAFPQAAAAPIRARVLAIGDAAFAHDPIGGRGISFALGSAFAAAATLRSWRDHPERRAAARLYYRRYVAAEQGRHLAFLREFYAAPRPKLAARSCRASCAGADASCGARSHSKAGSRRGMRCVSPTAARRAGSVASICCGSVISVRGRSHRRRSWRSSRRTDSRRSRHGCCCSGRWRNSSSPGPDAARHNKHTLISASCFAM